MDVEPIQKKLVEDGKVKLNSLSKIPSPSPSFEPNMKKIIYSNIEGDKESNNLTAKRKISDSVSVVVLECVLCHRKIGTSEALKVHTEQWHPQLFARIYSPCTFKKVGGEKKEEKRAENQVKEPSIPKTKPMEKVQPEKQNGMEPSKVARSPIIITIKRAETEKKNIVEENKAIEKTNETFKVPPSPRTNPMEKVQAETQKNDRSENKYR